ncbi:hypothetical protein EBR96_09640, partial [bacterium]|nr:hypothetical protein [bacterium]
TGSGKTSTLYAAIQEINDGTNKIITVEDPIEYKVSGLSQIKMDARHNVTYANVLRGVLRHDPDVILIGECRDIEAAEIAIEASMTGHLVLTTLHTNSAVSSILRLINLGVQAIDVSNALTAAYAQRLIRKLCPHCKKPIDLEPDKIDLIKKIVANAERLGKDMATYGIRSGMDMVVYGPVGCEECNNTGFKGRVGLYEAILTDDTIAKVMTQVPPPTERDIKKAAEHQKILTMIEDGVVKILTGLTSFDEVQGVVDLGEDMNANIEDELSTNDQVPHRDARSEDSNSATSKALPVERTAPLHASGEGGSRSETGEAGEEIILLIDYLKILEDHQRQHPDVGIADKIARVQHMIISILENTPNLENLFSPANPAMLVRDQIEGLMGELKTLEEDQTRNPNVGIANQIASIRNTIQTMRGEVAK